MLFVFGVVRGTTRTGFFLLIWCFTLLFWFHLKVTDNEVNERVLNDIVKRENRNNKKIKFLSRFPLIIKSIFDILSVEGFLNGNFPYIGVPGQLLWLARGQASQTGT